MMETLARAVVARTTIALPSSFADELIHATDLGRAIAMVASVDAPGHDVFNVGRGRHIDADEIAAALRALGAHVELAPAAGTAGAPIPPLDTTRIAEALGFAPEVSLRDGLRALCEHVGVAA
jgi:nucleoside-diphosphate-sugar epimerase